MGVLMRLRPPLARLAAGAASPEAPPEVSDRGRRRADAGRRVPAVDMTSELERLAGLHVAGELSDAEFRWAKSRLLGA